MKMSVKVILGAWLVIFAVLGGIVYKASLDLKPEAFIQVLSKEVQRNYPGAKLNIGNVDYRLALDFRLKLKNITLSRAETKIGSIGQIEVKIPWWLFVSSRGSVQINLSQLELYLAQGPASPSADASIPSIAKKSQKIKVSLPDYLMRAKYTLRAKNIVIKDAADSRRYFNLSKLLVREFQYGKNSAFELNLPIEINHNEAKYTSELWLFGDVTPEENAWDLNYRGEFKTRDLADKFQLEDLLISGKATLNPSEFQLSSDLSILIERDPIGSGKILANADRYSIDIAFQKFPLSYLSIVQAEIGNPYLPRFDGDAQGTVSFSKDSHSSSSSLTSRLSFEGELNLPAKSAFQGKWLLSLDDSKWETSFISPKGEVSYFRRSIIDYASGSLVQYNEELGFSGVDIGEAFSPVINLNMFRTSTSPLFFATSVSLKECTVGDKKVSGDIKYGTTPLEKFYQVNLFQDASTFALNYLSRNSDEKLSLEAKAFPWQAPYQFLSPFFSMSEGELNGKVDGNWKNLWFEGQWVMDLKVKGLETPGGDWFKFTSNLLNQFSLDPLTKDQTWNLNLKNKSMSIVNLGLDTTDPAKLQGILSWNSEKPLSQLTLTYPKNKKWKAVKKDVNGVTF